MEIGFLDGTLLIYDINANRLSFTSKDATQSIADIQFGYESESIFIMTFDQKLFKFDLNSKQVH